MNIFLFSPFDVWVTSYKYEIRLLYLIIIYSQSFLWLKYLFDWQRKFFACLATAINQYFLKFKTITADLEAFVYWKYILIMLNSFWNVTWPSQRFLKYSIIYNTYQNTKHTRLSETTRLLKMGLGLSVQI